MRRLPLVIAAAVLAGCAPAAPGSQQSTPAAASVTVDNCGTEVAFDRAPDRVLTIKSSTTEALLALGLGDRIVGTAFQDGPVPARWADAASELPEVSEQVPSQEAVLELEPDLVYAGWESNFAAEGAGERTDLQALGIGTYVSPSACKEPGYRPEKLTFDDVFADLEELASVFRADASGLIAEQRAEIEAIEPSGEERTALWYSSGTDTPYVGAGIGAPQLIMETVGLVNIASGIDDTWAPYNWESVVDADPDVIVLVDATWNTAESKIERLESNPATAGLSAVVNRRYLVVPFAASEAGVRTASAASDLANQLSRLDLPERDGAGSVAATESATPESG